MMLPQEAIQLAGEVRDLRIETMRKADRLGLLLRSKGVTGNLPADVIFPP